MKSFWILPLVSRDITIAAIAAATAASAFIAIIARYWSYYRLATPWSSLTLWALGLPLLTLTGFVLILSATAAARYRHIGHRTSLALGCALFVAALGGLFSLELARTGAARSGEGPGAGDLRPFARSILPR